LKKVSSLIPVVVGLVSLNRWPRDKGETELSWRKRKEEVHRGEDKRGRSLVPACRMSAEFRQDLSLITTKGLQKGPTPITRPDRGAREEEGD